MTQVAIIDYGMGNINSVAHALDYLGADCRRIVDVRGVERADILVLPGVGAFPHAMERLRTSGLDLAIRRRVLQDRVPLLGICLGMQLIAETSDEYGPCQGLGIVKGHVRRLRVSSGMCLPHVGWNVVRWSAESCDWRGNLLPEAHFYFDHSYVIEDTDAEILATADYGATFIAAISKGNVAAVQFHPEKSQNAGLRILRGFLNAAKGRQSC